MGLPSSINLRAPRDHRRLVLDLIHESPDGTTRAEIARSLELSRSAVSGLVDDLLRTGRVREQERREARAGRKPLGLEINASAGQIIGVDIGATHIRGILADIAGRPLAELNTSFDVKVGPVKTLAEVRRLVDRLMRDGESSLAHVRSVGLGVPGPVISERGVVLAAPIMPGWHEYPIRRSLEDAWQRPVVVHNDANLGALGEGTYGAAPTALQARELGRQGQRTHLSTLASLDRLSARDVAEAATKGDHLAQQLFAQAGENFGIALPGCVHMPYPG